MSWPPADGKPYRPSNGTEGLVFMDSLCFKCRNDHAHQASGGEEPGCRIIADSMCYSPGDPKYPTEWVWKDGQPTCTAFDDIDDEAPRITKEERAANLELPLEPRA